MNQKQKEWGIQLEDKLNYIKSAGYDINDFESCDMIKSFISSLLEKQRKEIIDEIEEALPKEVNNQGGYNLALKSVKQSIKKVGDK